MIQVTYAVTKGCSLLQMVLQIMYETFNALS